MMNGCGNMKLTIIAAVGKNFELGCNNQLIWKIPGDLQFFKRVTMNKTIVMGSKTYNSIPEQLPDRRHIVLSNSNIQMPEGVLVFNNFAGLLKKLKNVDEEVFIIGGYSIYKQFFPYVNKMYITHIDEESDDADVYFPNFNKEDWESILIFENDNDIKFKIVEYRRKQ